MEKHLLYEMLNGKHVEIKQEHFRHLNLEFVKQYHLINEMRTLGIDVNIDQLYLYSQLERKEIDLRFAKKNDLIEEENLQKVYDVFIKKAEAEQDITRAKSILNNYQTNDMESLKTATQIIEKVISKDDGYEIKDLEQVKKSQLQFIEKVFAGEEVDGVYLYSNTRNTSKQFMKLSYKLKYIADTDLVIIGGKASVGKTSFVLSLMNVLGKNGYNGLMFSLEMTSEQVIHRLATAKSGVTNNEIFNTKQINYDQQQRYYKGLEDISKLPLKIVDENIGSWLKMKQIIYDNKDSIDYVVIDHLTYIPSFDGDTSITGHQLITKVVRDMKQTAKELRIPILSLAQLSRAGAAGQGGKRIDDRYVEPFMRDLRESGSVEEYADKILLLYRIQDKDGEHEKYNVYQIACKVEKNRTGQTGDVEYYFYADKNRWREKESDS